MALNYYLYEIKNNLNNHVYVGVHQTSNLNDGYMGSGKILRNAIKKYGIENFTKTILETFDNENQMYSKEAEIVCEEFISRNDTYNITIGGLGGFSYINTNKLNDRSGFVFSEEQKKNVSRGKLANPSEKSRMIASKTAKKYLHTDKVHKKMANSLRGKPKSEEHKLKIKLALLKRNAGIV